MNQESGETLKTYTIIEQTYIGGRPTMVEDSKLEEVLEAYKSSGKEVKLSEGSKGGLTHEEAEKIVLEAGW